MKKFFLTFGLIGLCLSLSAQDAQPYQKGESMISIRNAQLSRVRASNDGAVIGARYGFELDYHRFIANNWSIGIGISLDRTQYTENTIDLAARTRGLQVSSRYYFPAIPIKSTYLSFFGEAWGGISRYSANIGADEINAISFDRTTIYGGLGASWRPFDIMSLDFVFHRGWQRMAAAPTTDLIFEGDVWNASVGLNFHLRPRMK